MIAPSQLSQAKIRGRCFVIEPFSKQMYSLDPLKYYGDLVYLFDGMETQPSIFDGIRSAEEFESRLDSHSFNVEKDYIVIAGTICKIVHLVSVATMKYGICNALMYKPSEKQYIAVEIGCEIAV